MRLLGVDFGRVRIGLAVMDSDTHLARNLPPLSATGTLQKDAIAIAKIAANEEANRVILGLPLQQDGEGKAAAIIRRLGNEIVTQGYEVGYADESLTSKAAESEMRDHGLKASQMRKSMDGMAATLILERYVEEA